MSRAPLPMAVATSIGSLPHTDPAAAVELVRTAHPRFPAAPQLPRRSPLEGMLAQVLWGVPGVRLSPDGVLSVDVRQLDAAADMPVAFPKDSWSGLLAFLDACGDHRGAAKLQLAGPVTVGLALIDAGTPAPLAFDVAGAAVRARAGALVALATERMPRASFTVFLDEPGLVTLAARETPIDRQDLVDVLSGALAALGRDVVTGVHCCGDTDWSLVTWAGPDILSIPVAPTVVAHATTLSNFLDAGGWIAWGAVPTDRPLGDDAEGSWRRLVDLWCELTREGCDPARLRRQALVTPECGLAGHGESQAARVLRIAADVAERAYGQAVAARLSVGA